MVSQLRPLTWERIEGGMGETTYTQLMMEGKPHAAVMRPVETRHCRASFFRRNVAPTRLCNEIGSPMVQLALAENGNTPI